MKHDVLSNIKRDIEGLIGQRVRVRANRGRRKVVEREGTVEKTYPSHFLVRLDEDQFSRKISFQYADVLTEVVELTICDTEGDSKFEVSVS